MPPKSKSKKKKGSSSSNADLGLPTPSQSINNLPTFFTSLPSSTLLPLLTIPRPQLIDTLASFESLPNRTHVRSLFTQALANLTALSETLCLPSIPLLKVSHPNVKHYRSSTTVHPQTTSYMPRGPLLTSYLQTLETTNADGAIIKVPYVITEVTELHVATGTFTVPDTTGFCTVLAAGSSGVVGRGVTLNSFSYVEPLDGDGRLVLRFVDTLTYPRPVRKWVMVVDESMTVGELTDMVGSEVEFEGEVRIRYRNKLVGGVDVTAVWGSTLKEMGFESGRIVIITTSLKKEEGGYQGGVIMGGRGEKKETGEGKEGIVFGNGSSMSDTNKKFVGDILFGQMGENKEIGAKGSVIEEYRVRHGFQIIGRTVEYVLYGKVKEALEKEEIAKKNENDLLEMMMMEEEVNSAEPVKNNKNARKKEREKAKKAEEAAQKQQAKEEKERKRELADAENRQKLEKAKATKKEEEDRERARVEAEWKVKQVQLKEEEERRITQVMAIAKKEMVERQAREKQEMVKRRIREEEEKQEEVRRRKKMEEDCRRQEVERQVQEERKVLERKVLERELEREREKLEREREKLEREREKQEREKIERMAKEEQAIAEQMGAMGLNFVLGDEDPEFVPLSSPSRAPTALPAPSSGLEFPSSQLFQAAPQGLFGTAALPAPQAGPASPSLPESNLSFFQNLRSDVAPGPTREVAAFDPDSFASEANIDLLMTTPMASLLDSLDDQAANNK